MFMFICFSLRRNVVGNTRAGHARARHPLLPSHSPSEQASNDSALHPQPNSHLTALPYVSLSAALANSPMPAPTDPRIAFPQLRLQPTFAFRLVVVAAI